MNLKNLALLTGLGLAAVSLTPAVASAAFDGWTTRGVTQHAGPGDQYPTVGFVPGGSQVKIYGCLRGVTQCDVAWRGNRGWVPGSALNGFYRNKRVPLISFGAQLGLPYITFNFGYWDNFYKNKPFFQQRGKWDKGWKKDNGPRKIGGPRDDHDKPGMGGPGKDGPGKGKGRDRDCKSGQMGGDCRPMKP